MQAVCEAPKRLTRDNQGDSAKVYIDPVLVLTLDDRNQVQGTQVVDRTTGLPIAFTGCVSSSWIVGHNPETNLTSVQVVLQGVEIQTTKG